MSVPPPSSEFSALTALRLVGTLGLVVAMGALLGLGLGSFAAHWWGHAGLFRACGILFGLMAGLAAAIRMLLKEVPWTR